jgi:serine/threonine-protein kinase
MDAPPEIKQTGGAHAGTLVSAPGMPAAPVGRYAPGVILSGKYRLEAVLGEGGMGAVWRASNLLLELPVAIKLIRADLDRSSLRARLQVEARAAAKLGHPAIVRVFDVGESEFGDPFIVMELMHGETLAQMISQGRLSAARTVQLLLPIIDALALAHLGGIVHRDLKPDNLMIAREQQRIQPKILDFGIAKLTDPRDSDHKLTEVGMVVGSPDYMSPEQARGRDDVDAGSDIWAICVVLYEAVTGSTPFSASNYNALLRAIVEDAPKSLVEHAAGDQALWEIVKRGLAKNRADRQASMAELGQSLAGWLLSHGVFEDACGTSLESKWFNHSNRPPNVSEVSGGSRAISADFQPKLTHDSRPNGTGVDSPPFTATIPARSSGRARTVSAALFACALLAALLFGFARSQTARPTQSLGAAAAPVVHNVTATAAAVEQPPEPAVLAPEPPASVTEPPAAAVVRAEPVAVAQAKPVARPLPAPAKLPVTTVRANASHPSKATPAVPSVPPAASVPQAAKPAERPLDLLAPY